MATESKNNSLLGNQPAKTYIISNLLSVNLGNVSTKNNEYFSFDFVCMDEPSFETYMTRDKLRGLALFILNYLENE